MHQNLLLLFKGKTLDKTLNFLKKKSRMFLLIYHVSISASIRIDYCN